MNDTTAIILIFAAILVIGGAILLGIVMRGSGRKINQDKYRSAWLKIENSLNKDNEASQHMAILNADKLLDSAMRDLGFRGNTMGERLKNSKSSFRNINAVWTAHKMRNQIAHEPNFKIDYANTRRALAIFKQALRDIGAI